MVRCVVCSSDDAYDCILTSHVDRYSLRLDAKHARIEVYDMKSTPEVLLTDALVKYCPMCGRQLGIEVDENVVIK